MRALPIVLVLSLLGGAQFSDTQWGMSPTELVEAEGDEIEQSGRKLDRFGAKPKDATFYVQERVILDHAATAHYRFDSEQLSAVKISFHRPEDAPKGGPDGVYQRLKRLKERLVLALDEKYGPHAESTKAGACFGCEEPVYVFTWASGVVMEWNADYMAFSLDVLYAPASETDPQL